MTDQKVNAPARLVVALRDAGSLARRDPKLWARLLRGRALRILPTRRRASTLDVGHVKVWIDPATDSWQADWILRGAYEADLVILLQRSLPVGGVFIDVGASIGFISAVGLNAVGQAGAVHAFEPDPTEFARLGKLQELNPGYHLHLRQTALGDDSGSAQLERSRIGHIGANSLVRGYMDDVHGSDDHISVPVMRFDDYAEEVGLDGADFIKIDVEGFELPVLRGMTNFLTRIDPKPAIVCEVTPLAYPLIGASLQELSDLLSGLGYEARSIQKPYEHVEISLLREQTNVLFQPSRGSNVR